MKFTASHEWIVLHEKTGTVGITQHAQKELGEIVYAELPKVGTKVEAGDEVCVLESTKAAADIYSPVSGIVTEVNTALKSEIHRINHSSEQEGWLFKIQITDSEEYNNLMGLSEYHELIKN